MGRTTAQKKWRSCSQTWQKDYATAVGDTTKAYFSICENFIFWHPPKENCFQIYPKISHLITRYLPHCYVVCQIFYAQKLPYGVSQRLYEVRICCTTRPSKRLSSNESWRMGCSPSLDFQKKTIQEYFYMDAIFFSPEQLFDLIFWSTF